LCNPLNLYQIEQIRGDKTADTGFWVGKMPSVKYHARVPSRARDDAGTLPFQQSLFDAVVPAAPKPVRKRNWGGPYWLSAAKENARFYLNKAVHFRPSGWAGTPASGFFCEARVTAQGCSGLLPYFVIRDENGIRRGSQPSWIYLQNVAACADDKMKAAIFRQLLAQLPSDVSFHFVFGPYVQDEALVRSAFQSVGFTLWDVETFVYTPPPQWDDLIGTLTGKSIRGTLRRARRDLETVEMSTSEFFRFQEKNLAGKDSYRNTNADRAMLEEGLLRNKAKIIAVRRRASPENPGPFPPAAAMACLWDATDGYYKLWRLTHRRRENTDAPAALHPDATKLLVLTAMEEAAKRQLLLETDGSTPGLAKLYATFGPGILRRTWRLECTRDTFWSLMAKYYPSCFHVLNSRHPS
jgi:hypothetical protein